MSNWIRCGDALPRIGDDVLVCLDGSKVLSIMCVMENGWYSDFNGYSDRDRVAHWMPLPEPPETGCEVATVLVIFDDDQERRVALEIEKGLDRDIAITEAATLWCSDHGYEYVNWEEE
jgi:hypothetical protein